MDTPLADAVTSVTTLSLTYEHQEVVLSRLTQADAAFWHRQPGLISSRLLRGLDGTRILVERTWVSRDAFEAAGALPEAAEERAWLDRFAAVDARLYESAGGAP